MKKIIAVLSISGIALTPMAAFAAESAHHLPTAQSILVVSRATGKVLFSRSVHVKRSPASTVKMLTALVAMDELRLDQIITVSSFVEGTPRSRIDLRSGERFYVRDLLRALLISSANDAAKALAVAAAGSEYQFTLKMNEKAKQFGVKNSHFTTANGLPAENQYSTVYDLMKIFVAAEESSFIMKTLGTKYAQITSLDGRRIKLKNHNKMLWRDVREIVGKTGWTRNAGHCFVGRIRNGSKSVYIAILASRKTWPDIRYVADKCVGGLASSGGKPTDKSFNRASYYNHYDIKKIQLALKRAGFFYREPTGYFGSITKRALKRFQRAHHLEPDGVVGPSTWQALVNYL